MVHSPVHAISADENPTCLPLAPEEFLHPLVILPSWPSFWPTTSRLLLPLPLEQGQVKIGKSHSHPPIEHSAHAKSTRLLGCSRLRCLHRNWYAGRLLFARRLTARVLSSSSPASTSALRSDMNTELEAEFKPSSVNVSAADATSIAAAGLPARAFRWAPASPPPRVRALRRPRAPTCATANNGRTRRRAATAAGTLPPPPPAVGCCAAAAAPPRRRRGPRGVVAPR